MSRNEFDQIIDSHLRENRLLHSSRGMPKFMVQLVALFGLQFWKIGLVISFILSFWLYLAFEKLVVQIIKLLFLVS